MSVQKQMTLPISGLPVTLIVREDGRALLKVGEEKPEIIGSLPGNQYLMLAAEHDKACRARAKGAK